MLALLVVVSSAAPAIAAPSNAAIMRAQAKWLDPQDRDGSDLALNAQPGDELMSPPSARAAAVAPSPAVGGSWAYLPPPPSDFNAIHIIGGPGGKMLLIAGSGNSTTSFAAGKFQSYLWDPAAGSYTKVATPEDLFCAGHVLLPDGRALVVGGTSGYSPFKGINAIYAFNFATSRYEALTRAERARWYPSLLTMGDGRTLITSGLNAAGALTKESEVFDYRTDQHSLLPGSRTLPTYPRLHLAGSGKVFYTGASNTGSDIAPGFWDPFNGNTFAAVPGLGLATQQRGAGATCFIGDVASQKLMVMGGRYPVTSTTSVITLNAASPAFTSGPPLLAAKAYLSCMNLPNGWTLEANGGTANNIASASSEVGLLKTASGPWTAMAPLPAGEHRLYHAGLCLLDDGRVISVTSNPSGEARSKSLLVYSPPYMYSGTRPVITRGLPTEITYGRGYPVAATASGTVVDRFTFTTPPSETHGFNNDQRYNSMTIVNGQITITGKRNDLPPGWHRLWAVDRLNRPSKAMWVHLS